MTTQFIPMPGNEPLSTELSRLLDCDAGQIEIRHFPDGESYVRLLSNVEKRSLALVCTLARPNDKILDLVFAAETARELGATKIGLVCPYLAYMRQDRRFKPGEAVTSREVAKLLSDAFDWLVTVDPHLHRYGSLAEIYRIPTQIVHAAQMISAWIKKEVKNAIIIGPDSESEQWVSAVAKDAGAPFTVLEKTRHGDRDVEITVRNVDSLHGRTPVFVDDIISTGRTMLQAVRLIASDGKVSPVCIAVHGLFADNSDVLLEQAGARVVTCNTVPHPSNEIDVWPALADATHAIDADALAAGGG